jgi:Fic family protein
LNERQTISLGLELIADPEERAATEAENALLQFDRVLDLIDEAVRDGRPFRLRPSTVTMLHGVAMKAVHAQAGTFRNAPVEIAGSKHAPPGEHLVQLRVEDMCEWVNENWRTKSALELCAYVMWRLNWIHPFADGNGRTTRAIAYLILCVRAGARLPGAPSIPEQIAENKPPYYEALEAADRSQNTEDPNLTEMMNLLGAYLKRQLDGILA